jgi:hypothetical protein
VQHRPIRNPDTAYRAVGQDGGLVVLPGESSVKVLNPVGSKVYSMIDGKHTVDEIVAAVVDDFDIDADQARQDVEVFLKELQEHGMLQQADKQESVS